MYGPVATNRKLNFSNQSEVLDMSRIWPINTVVISDFGMPSNLLVINCTLGNTYPVKHQPKYNIFVQENVFENVVCKMSSIAKYTQNKSYTTELLKMVVTSWVI